MLQWSLFAATNTALPMNRRIVSILNVPTKSLPSHSLFRYSGGIFPDEEELQNLLHKTISEAEADGWRFVELAPITGALLRDQGDASFSSSLTCALAITWEQVGPPQSDTA